MTNNNNLIFNWTTFPQQSPKVHMNSQYLIVQIDEIAMLQVARCLDIAGLVFIPLRI